MKRSLIILILLLIYQNHTQAQRITYSDTRSEENTDISFEILGKLDSNYIIYKSIRWKHVLGIYDNNMKLIESKRIKFIPEKTFNIDFVVYPAHFFMIYQYQKNNIIHCMAVKMDALGEKMGEPVELDTTRIGVLADNKIYTTAFSDDRQKILVYKMHLRNDKLTIATKLFDSEMKLVNKTRTVYDYDEKRDVYSDLYVANDGTLLFSKGGKFRVRDNISRLQIFYKPLDSANFISKDIHLNGKYIDEIRMKIDNLNGRYIINSFFSNESRENIAGIFTAVFRKRDTTSKIAFNVLDDSLRSRFSTTGQFRHAFDNLFLRNTIVKKDGGFIVSSEEYSTHGRSGSPWNRYDYLGSYPYTSSYDYYLSSPYSFGYYRPYRNFGSLPSIRYFYDGILVMSMDSSLNLQWKTVIYKKQFDDDTDNHLSFATMTGGGELRYLFSEDNNKHQIITNHGITPSGQIKRYATLKSREVGYAFMPRLAKQTGLREIIIPCIYRGNVAFAKVEFFE